jgi:hypothetical protein
MPSSGGSFDSDQNKTPAAIILDEAHQYYVSDFVLPFYTGTRKHNVGIKIFSQSCNNFPPNDIDIFLSTAAHLVTFGIGSKDATRLASDILLPRNHDMVKHATRDLYGSYGDMNYYYISEQKEHAIAEIMRQSQRRLFWRVRTADDIKLYLAETAYVPKLSVPHEEEMAYRRESARHHAPEPPSTQ